MPARCLFIFPALSAVEISFSQIKLLNSHGGCEKEHIVAGLLVAEATSSCLLGVVGTGLAAIAKNNPQIIRTDDPTKVEKLRSVSGSEYAGGEVVFWILCEVLCVQRTADWIGPCYRDGDSSSILLSR